MYSCGFESVTFVGMSTTTSQVFVPETDAKVPMNDEFGFRLIRPPTSECFPADQCQVISGAADASTDDDDREKKIQERLKEEDRRDCDQPRASEKDEQVGKRIEEEEEEEEEEDVEEDDASHVEKLEISKVGLSNIHHRKEEEGLQEEEDEEINDGFRTPTSLETKIPAIRRCPPAPRKPRSDPSIKRSRPYSSTTSCRVRIDVSDHVLDSLFQPIVSDLISPSNKKARKIN